MISNNRLSVLPLN